ncbi:MAG: flippase [Candidatus Thermoplasmatota archaeon]|nr:flippase [Candidatus Thermoplasmatota archaeon]
MIARKSALIIATQLANSILGYIGLKFIALYMDPWEYGVVGFAYGFVALFSVFGNLGFDSAHVKRVSEGKDLRKCIGTFISVKLFLAGFMASVVILSIAIWKYVIGRGFESPLHEQTVYVMLAYFALLVLTQSMISTFNARKEIAKVQLPLFGYTFARVIVTIFVAFYGLGALALAYAYVFGEIFHFIIALLFFREYSVSKSSLEYFKDYSKFAVPMAIASASAIIMANIDKVFIQLFWSARQVGEYFAIFNLSRFIILFVTAVGMLLFPTISEHHAKNNMKEIKKLTLLSERYLSMIVFPIVVIMVFLAEPIIHILLSDKYMPALPVLQILPFFVLIEALSRPYSSQLSGMDMPTLNRNRVVLMAVGNVLLNLILIPRDIKSMGLKLAGLGGEGAAIATVVSYIVGLTYIRIVAWRVTGIKGNYRIIFHGMATGVTAFVLYHVNKVTYIGRWYELAGVAAFGMAVYFAILFVMREFKREDFDLFMDTLNIKKMFGYIREELKGK